MSTATQYTREYFIAKFEAIAPERFCTGEFLDDDGNSCALGHCGLNFGVDTAEAAALMRLFSRVGLVSRINDGNDYRYPQPTPKQRILAALRDLPETEGAAQ